MKEKTYLTLAEKTGYGLGDAASNFFFQTFGIFLLFYYVDIFGLDPAAVATMFLVTRLWDTFNDPIMGLIADRTRSRWGKFRPYLLWAAVPYGIIGYIMFLGPDFEETGRLMYAYVTYTAMMMVYTVINVPYSALMGVMTPSPGERTVLSSFRFFFAHGAGLLVSRLFIPLKDALGGGNDVAGVQYTMAIFAGCSILLFIVTFLTTRERVLPQKEGNNRIREDLGDLFRNWPWILISVVTVLQLVSMVVRDSSVVFYFKYIVGDENRASNFLMFGKLAIITGIVLNGLYARKLDKKFLLITYSAISGVCFGSIFFLPVTEATLPAVYTLQIVGSLAFGPLGVLLWSMYGDCADYGEWKSGRRATALVFSSSLFAIKLGVTIGGALPGWILSACGFIANQEQTDSAKYGINLLMNGIPSVVIIAFTLIALAYPLTRPKLERIEIDLAEKKGEAPPVTPADGAYSTSSR